MDVAAKFFTSKLRLLAIGLVLVTTSVSLEVAQASSSGAIYEKSFVKVGVKPEVFKDSFAVSDLDSDYFLSVIALDKRSSIVSVLVNGKTVANILSPTIFQRHLVKLNVLASNSIEVKIAGAKASSSLVKVFKMNSFAPIFGPEEFIKDKKLISKFSRDFDVIDIKSQHLLVVEANSNALKDKSLAIIKLNNKTIVNPLDFIFDKKNRFIIPISVQEKNKLEVSLIGKESSGIKVSVLSPEEEELPSPGKLSLVNLNPKAFNPAGADVVIKLDGAVFPSSSPSVTIVYNEEVLGDDKYSVTANQITIPAALILGENIIEVVAFDADGGSLSLHESLWAGSSNVTIDVHGAEGSVANADVTAVLTNDQEVMAQGKTNANGQLVITNIPPRTILYTAKSGIRQEAYAEMSFTDYVVDLELKNPLEPGEATNLDFSQGLEGWVLSNPDAVELIPHVEENVDVPAVSSKSALTSLQYAPADISKMTFEQRKAYRKSQVPIASKSASQAKISSGIEFDQYPDMALSTSGSTNPVYAKRSIKIAQGVKFLKIKYKFVTEEIPAGYFGSEFNDSYQISMYGNIPFQPGSGTSGSMNGLGFDAFSDQGATVWKELTYRVGPNDTSVNIYAQVQNVGDELFDSKLIIESIQGSSFGIVSAELYDIDQSQLNFLSVAWNNPYFLGNTFINASVRINGDVDDSVEWIYVGINQKGSQLGGLTVIPEKQPILNRIGSTGIISFLNEKLFSLLNKGAETLFQDKDTSYQLIVRAKNGAGQISEVAIPRPIQLLTRSKKLTSSQRFGTTRDPEVGGDDWGTPSCIGTADALIESFASMSFQVNDFSNMNGGEFKGHTSHRRGTDFDYRIAGLMSNRMPNAFDAQRALQIVRNNSNIQYMIVTFKMADGNSFYDAIKNEFVNGISAKNIFRPGDGHKDHFHIRCRK